MAQCAAMTAAVHFPLQVSAPQAASLQALQTLFTEGCNLLAPLVRDARCWNRVALHHLAYRGLRERLPQLGSQMACNVIYSVCRSARIVYQHPLSPWNVAKNPQAALPLLHFLPGAPVYFDKHTLSLKDDRLSLFTLDGRIHFKLDLEPLIVQRFRSERLREISLLRHANRYALHFLFAGADAPEPLPAWGELPQYLLVQPADEAQDPAPGTAIAPPQPQLNPPLNPPLNPRLSA